MSQSIAGEDGAHRGEWRRPIAAAALVAMLTACANPARIPSNSGALYGTVSDPPAWMVGLWRRDWIEMRGVRSSPTEVHYLQSARQFADVRLPHSRARLAHARSFDDLTNDDLRLLAQQRGFTGPATARGDTVTWGHEIDFQPPDDTPDVGRVQRLGAERMHEIALDRSYVESWRLEDGRERSSVVVRVEQAGRLHEVLVVVGDDFFYVRNRATDLPHAVSLDALMTATNASRAQMIAYLDCEFSTGRVRAGRVPWDVQLSTLPWREGHPLAFAQRMKRSLDSTSLVVVVGPTARATIALNTLSKAALASLFPPPP